MEIIVFLSIVIAVVAVLTSIVLVRRVKKQIAEMTDVLVDVKNGNGNRRILSATNELTAPLAYEINEIVVAYESRLSTVRQTEETNRQLMTSLSHDVRTPLTTLIGYLDAAHKGLVTGKDRDDYIETARRKAHDLKEYIDVLFDWFKLNSNEFALEIQSVEAAELTRNILIDWIPIFEDKQVDYDIDIPEQPVRVRLDMDSYMRIVNNLIQNVIAHSHADKIKIVLSKKQNSSQLITIMTHHSATIDEIMSVFLTRFGMRCQNILQQKTLRSTCYKGIRPFRYLQSPVFLLYHKCLRSWNARNTITILAGSLYTFQNGPFIDKWANSIVYQHHTVIRIISCCTNQTIINGVLTSLSTRHHFYHFGDTKLIYQLVHIRNPILDAHYHNTINIQQIIKQFNGIDDDGLAIQF